MTRQEREALFEELKIAKVMMVSSVENKELWEREHDCLVKLLGRKTGKKVKHKKLTKPAR